MQHFPDDPFTANAKQNLWQTSNDIVPPSAFTSESPRHSDMSGAFRTPNIHVLPPTDSLLGQSAQQETPNLAFRDPLTNRKEMPFAHLSRPKVRPRTATAEPITLQSRSVATRKQSDGNWVQRTAGWFAEAGRNFLPSLANLIVDTAGIAAPLFLDPDEIAQHPELAKRWGYQADGGTTEQQRQLYALGKESLQIALPDVPFRSRERTNWEQDYPTLTAMGQGLQQIASDPLTYIQQNPAEFILEAGTAGAGFALNAPRRIAAIRRMATRASDPLGIGRALGELPSIETGRTLLQTAQDASVSLEILHAGGVGTGTGTYIGRNRIQTAAHILLGGEGGAIQPTAVIGNRLGRGQDPVQIAGIQSIDVQGDIAILETITPYENPIPRAPSIETSEGIFTIGQGDVYGLQLQTGHIGREAFRDPTTGATLHTSTLTAEGGVSGAGILNRRGEIVGSYLGELETTRTGLVGSSNRQFKDTRTRQITDIDTETLWQAQQRHGLHYRVAGAGLIGLHTGSRYDDTPLAEYFAMVDRDPSLSLRSVNPEFETPQSTLDWHSFDLAQSNALGFGEITPTELRPHSYLRDRHVSGALLPETFEPAVFRQGVFASNTLAHQRRYYLGKVGGLGEGGTELRVLQGQTLDAIGDELIVQPQLIQTRFSGEDLAMLLGDYTPEEAFAGFNVGDLRLHAGVRDSTKERLFGVLLESNEPRRDAYGKWNRFQIQGTAFAAGERGQVWTADHVLNTGRTDIVSARLIQGETAHSLKQKTRMRSVDQYVAELEQSHRDSIYRFREYYGNTNLDTAYINVPDLEDLEGLPFQKGRDATQVGNKMMIPYQPEQVRYGEIINPYKYTFDADSFHYSARTQGGMSGSPVFTKEGVVGIHKSAMYNRETNAFQYATATKTRDALKWERRQGLWRLGKQEPQSLDLRLHSGFRNWRTKLDIRNLPIAQLLGQRQRTPEFSPETADYIKNLYPHPDRFSDQAGEAFTTWLANDSPEFRAIDENPNAYWRIAMQTEHTTEASSYDQIGLYLHELDRKGHLKEAPYDLRIPDRVREPLEGVFAYSKRADFRESLAFGLEDILIPHRMYHQNPRNLRAFIGTPTRNTPEFFRLLQPSEHIVKPTEMLIDMPFTDTLRLHSGTRDYWERVRERGLQRRQREIPVGQTLDWIDDLADDPLPTRSWTDLTPEEAEQYREPLPLHLRGLRLHSGQREITADRVFKFFAPEERQRLLTGKGSADYSTRDAVNLLKQHYPEAETLGEVITRAAWTDDVWFRAHRERGLEGYSSYDLSLTNRLLEAGPALTPLHRRTRMRKLQEAVPDAFMENDRVYRQGVFATAGYGTVEQYLKGVEGRLASGDLVTEGGSMLHIFTGEAYPRTPHLDWSEHVVRPQTEIYQVHKDHLDIQEYYIFDGERYPMHKNTETLMDAPAELFAVDPRRRFLVQERPLTGDLRLHSGTRDYWERVRERGLQRRQREIPVGQTLDWIDDLADDPLPTRSWTDLTPEEAEQYREPLPLHLRGLRLHSGQREITADRVFKFFAPEERQRLLTGKGSADYSTRDAVNLLKQHYPEAETLGEVITRAAWTDDVWFRAHRERGLEGYSSYDLSLTNRLLEAGPALTPLHRRTRMRKLQEAVPDAFMENDRVYRQGVFATAGYGTVEQYLKGVEGRLASGDLVTEGGSMLHIFTGEAYPRTPHLDWSEHVVRPQTEIYQVHKDHLDIQEYYIFDGERYPMHKNTETLMDAPAELFAVDPRRRFLVQERPLTGDLRLHSGRRGGIEWGNYALMTLTDAQLNRYAQKLGQPDMHSLLIAQGRGEFSMMYGEYLAGRHAETLSWDDDYTHKRRYVDVLAAGNREFDNRRTEIMNARTLQDAQRLMGIKEKWELEGYEHTLRTGTLPEEVISDIRASISSEAEGGMGEPYKGHEIFQGLPIHEVKVARQYARDDRVLKTENFQYRTGDTGFEYEVDYTLDDIRVYARGLTASGVGDYTQHNIQYLDPTGRNILEAATAPQRIDPRIHTLGEYFAWADAQENIMYRSTNPLENWRTHRSIDYEQSRVLRDEPATFKMQPHSFVIDATEAEKAKFKMDRLVMRNAIYGLPTIEHQWGKGYLGGDDDAFGGSQLRQLRGTAIPTDRNTLPGEVIMRPEALVGAIEGSRLKELVDVGSRYLMHGMKSPETLARSLAANPGYNMADLLNDIIAKTGEGGLSEAQIAPSTALKYIPLEESGLVLHGGKRRARRGWQTMYHATHPDNIPSILEHGLDPTRSRGKRQEVYLFTASREGWARDHINKKHNIPTGEVPIFEVNVPRESLTRRWRGIWSTPRYIPPEDLKLRLDTGGTRRDVPLAFHATGRWTFGDIWAGEDQLRPLTQQIDPDTPPRSRLHELAGETDRLFMSYGLGSGYNRGYGFAFDPEGLIRDHGAEVGHDMVNTFEMKLLEIANASAERGNIDPYLARQYVGATASMFGKEMPAGLPRGWQADIEAEFAKAVPSLIAESRATGDAAIDRLRRTGLGRYPETEIIIQDPIGVDSPHFRGFEHEGILWLPDGTRSEMRQSPMYLTPESLGLGQENWQFTEQFPDYGGLRLHTGLRKLLGQRDTQGAEIPGLPEFLSAVNEHPRLFYRFENPDAEMIHPSQDLAQTHAYREGAPLTPDAFFSEETGLWGTGSQDPKLTGSVFRRGVYGYKHHRFLTYEDTGMETFRRNLTPLEWSMDNKELQILFGTPTPYQKHLASYEDVVLPHGILTTFPTNIEPFRAIMAEPGIGEFIETGHANLRKLTKQVSELPTDTPADTLWQNFIAGQYDPLREQLESRLRLHTGTQDLSLDELQRRVRTSLEIEREGRWLPFGETAIPDTRDQFRDNVQNLLIEAGEIQDTRDRLGDLSAIGSDFQFMSPRMTTRQRLKRWHWEQTGERTWGKHLEMLSDMTTNTAVISAAAQTVGQGILVAAGHDFQPMSMIRAGAELGIALGMNRANRRFGYRDILPEEVRTFDQTTPTPTHATAADLQELFTRAGAGTAGWRKGALSDAIREYGIERLNYTFGDDAATYLSQHAHALRQFGQTSGQSRRDWGQTALGLMSADFGDVTRYVYDPKSRAVTAATKERLSVDMLLNRYADHNTFLSAWKTRREQIREGDATDWIGKLTGQRLQPQDVQPHVGYMMIPTARGIGRFFNRYVAEPFDDHQWVKNWNLEDIASGVDQSIIGGNWSADWLSRIQERKLFRSQRNEVLEERRMNPALYEWQDAQHLYESMAERLGIDIGDSPTFARDTLAVPYSRWQNVGIGRFNVGNLPRGARKPLIAAGIGAGTYMAHEMLFGGEDETLHLKDPAGYSLSPRFPILGMIQRTMPYRRLRARGEMLLDDVFGEDTFHNRMMRSIVIGEKNLLPKDVTETYVETGQIHALVQSGMHVNLFAGILRKFPFLGIPAVASVMRDTLMPPNEIVEAESQPLIDKYKLSNDPRVPRLNPRLPTPDHIRYLQKQGELPMDYAVEFKQPFGRFTWWDAEENYERRIDQSRRRKLGAVIPEGRARDIYNITNIWSDKQYWGLSTSSGHGRIAKHLTGKGSQSIAEELQISKFLAGDNTPGYTHEDFRTHVFTLPQGTTYYQLGEWEKHMIAQGNTMEEGYNRSPGGEIRDPNYEYQERTAPFVQSKTRLRDAVAWGTYAMFGIVPEAVATYTTQDTLPPDPMPILRPEDSLWKSSTEIARQRQQGLDTLEQSLRPRLRSRVGTAHAETPTPQFTETPIERLPDPPTTSGMSDQQRLMLLMGENNIPDELVTEITKRVLEEIDAQKSDNYTTID